MATVAGAPDEREMLAGFLDWYRAVVENKVRGLAEADASRVMTPSGLTVLGTVKHLALVERGWFRDVFMGEDVARVSRWWIEGPGESGDDNWREFTLEPTDSVEDVLSLYRSETSHARRIATAAPSLESVSARGTFWRGQVTLRWILTHVLEETARHAGHLDLMREAIDGVTGD